MDHKNPSFYDRKYRIIDIKIEKTREDDVSGIEVTIHYSRWEQSGVTHSTTIRWDLIPSGIRDYLLHFADLVIDHVNQVDKED